MDGRTKTLLRCGFMHFAWWLHLDFQPHLGPYLSIDIYNTQLNKYIYTMVQVLTMSGSWYNASQWMVFRRSLLHGWQSAFIISFNEIIPPTTSWSIYLPNRKIPPTISTFSSSTRWSKFGCFFFGKKTGSASNSSCKDTHWSYLVAALQNMVGSRCIRNLKKTLGWNRDH